MAEKALAKTKPMGLREYMRQDEIKSRFSEIVGQANAGGFISSVLIAAAGNEALQNCEMKSIVSSAMRAATLQLSVDPSTGYAYLVPYGKTANLIVGYKGLYQMAIRTGKYRYITVEPVFQGEVVNVERFTGVVNISGEKKSDKTIGYVGYFEMIKGYKKYLYMTVEEIEEHAKKFSKAYGMDSKNNIWKTNRQAMEKKTVLRLLLTRWADLSGISLADVDAIDGDVAELPDPGTVTIEAVDVDKTIAEMGFESAKAKKSEPIDAQFEDIMAEAEVTEVEPEPEPEPEARPSRPYEPEYLKKAVQGMAEKAKEQGKKAKDTDKKILLSEMRTLFAGMANDLELAKKVLMFLSGVDAPAMLEDAEILAIKAWLKITPDDGGELMPSSMAITEANKIIALVNKS